jgi:APA family basic amino acid/polyamine antiporter
MPLVIDPPMLKDQLLARKSLETLLAEMSGEQRLRRILGPISLTSLGVGAIIGAGIFVMTGRTAAQQAGPAIMLSYVVAGLGCAMAALCYAEFASMVPVAGSAYTYAYATLGELFAWIIGWDLILEYAMSCSVVAANWTKYFNEFLEVFFHWRLWPQLSSDPFSVNMLTGARDGWLNLPAVLIMGLVTVVLVVGIRESATTNAFLVGIKVAVVLFVIVAGCWYISPANWFNVPVEARLETQDSANTWGLLGTLGLNRWLLPLDDGARTPFVPYGVSGIMVGAATVFFAFIGFDSISTHSEEARRPQRDVPIGILASLGICTLLYFGVAAVITGMEPYPQIDPSAAVAAAFRHRAEQEGSPLLRLAAGFIATGALAGITSVLLITFLSQARIFLAMARDRLLPPGVFGAVHPRFRTPHISTMLTGAIICLVAAFTPIIDLENMVNIGTAMAFITVCAAVLILRRRRPEARRPFRCPLLYVVAPLGIAVNLFMVLFLPPATWLRLVIWLAIGLGIYFTYGRRHSLLGQLLARQRRDKEAMIIPVASPSVAPYPLVGEGRGGG